MRIFAKYEQSPKSPIHPEFIDSYGRFALCLVRRQYCDVSSSGRLGNQGTRECSMRALAANRRHASRLAQASSRNFFGKRWSRITLIMCRRIVCIVPMMNQCTAKIPKSSWGNESDNCGKKRIGRRRNSQSGPRYIGTMSAALSVVKETQLLSIS